jgi:segregation and condensation protein A
MDLENYSVKTEVFEGPLDVLLSLIEKRKLLINDISLSKVADDYMAYIRELGKIPLADTAQFVLIASTLILIKSKSLLPGIELSEEEQGSIDDLEHRLKMRQKYKELALHVKKLFGKHMLFYRLPKREMVVVFSPDKNTTKDGLVTKIKYVLANIPKIEVLPKTIVKKVISLEEAIVSLTERISKSLRMNFKEFAKSGGKEEKVNVIVSFLAMLELVKQGIIAVRQDKAFHDIEMQSDTVGVPQYRS